MLGKRCQRIGTLHVFFCLCGCWPSLFVSICSFIVSSASRNVAVYSDAALHNNTARLAGET